MEESDHFETDNNMDRNSARGQENAISDIPLGGTGTVGSMGVGGGGLAGCFGFRDGGGRKKAVGRFGGSEATESAVEAALRWLARHQDPQGFWSYADHEGLDKYENIAKYNVAMTGLAMLAFLGAGYTSKEGKHRDTLRRAEKWLVAQQGEDGHWAEFMYTQGIATLATVEAYGMVQDPVLKKAAQKGVDAILKAQRPYEAWDYSPVAKTTPAGGQNDTSVSSWQMQALKSARLAGLKVDGNAFLGMTNWLDAGQQLRPEQSGSKYGHMAYRGTLQSPRGGGLALLGVAAMCRMYLGQERTHPGIERPIEFISSGHLPKWPGQAGSGQNYYYWYYGTLACFQYGAEPWKKWNADMSKMLIEHQCRGGLGKCKCADKNDDGSWPPEQEIDIRAGRVFTTALSAMILEVYYRYLPIYREGK